MNNDFILVLGVVVAALAIPSVINAFSRSKPPRAAVIFFVAGGVLISWAVIQQPNTYSLDGFPELALRVVADLF
jgi:hypothetical protein